MIPGTYNFKMYRGDWYYGSVIPLFSLVPWGGPSNPCAAGIERSAQIRIEENAEEVVASFDVVVVDEDDMTVRLTMDPAGTALLPPLDQFGPVWDLQISTAPNRVWTPYAGRITPLGQVTR